VRVFAALPLPPPVVAAIGSSFSELRTLFPRLRWTRAEGLHFTLHFFGELPDQSVDALRRVMDDPDLARPAIRARLGPVGQFPARGSPRVIWVGIGKGQEAMSAYSRLFEEKIAPLGFAPDPRGFTPHVTIARAADIRLDDGWGAGVAMPAEDFLLDECVLYQSILGRGGAEYRALKSIELQKDRDESR